MRATAINRKGQTVGLAVVPSTTIGSAWGSNEVVAFLYDRGQTTFFTFPSGGVDHSSAHAITDKGLIAGLIYTPDARGVLYDLRTGTQTTLRRSGVRNRRSMMLMRLAWRSAGLISTPTEPMHSVIPRSLEWRTSARLKIMEAMHTLSMTKE